MNLRSYQEKAVENILAHKRYGLLWSCGVGKTLPALVAIKKAERKGIVVCREAAKDDTWNKANREVGADIELYNYTSFHKLTNKDIYNKFVVYDESHNLSHRESARSQHALSLTDYYKSVFLSGSPIADKPIDAFMLLLLLRLREDTDTEFYRFRAKYAIMKKKMIGWMRTKTGRKFPKYVKDIVGWKNLNVLREELAPLTSYLKLEQVEDMPKAQFIPIYFPLTPTEKREYTQAKTDKVHLMQELRLCSKYSAIKASDIINKIRQESGEKMVVYSNFIDTVKSVATELSGVEFIGETEVKETVLNGWRENNDLLVTTYKTGAESLNLQEASYEIFIDLPHYLLELMQAAKRIYRSGQKKPCVYYVMVPEGTIMEKVFNRLNQKFDLVTKVWAEENMDILKLMTELKNEI